MSRLHIKSDGTANGTIVLDEYGQPIEYITGIEWSVDVEDGLARANIHFAYIPVDVVAEIKSHRIIDNIDKTIEAALSRVYAHIETLGVNLRSPDKVIKRSHRSTVSQWV